ncbi:MAG TPA: hypothetical protein VMX56_09030, partial [Anaerolineales bacterium]|nr:hypothetical protein [Anaerolineales bacterium]
ARCYRVQGTTHPNMQTLVDFVAIWAEYQDVTIEQLIEALPAWTGAQDKGQLPTPGEVHVFLIGYPDLDSFEDLMDNFIATGRVAEYRDPLGIQVLRAMGGSMVFKQMSGNDRGRFKSLWSAKYKEIQADQRRRKK